MNAIIDFFPAGSDFEIQGPMVFLLGSVRNVSDAQKAKHLGPRTIAAISSEVSAVIGLPQWLLTELNPAEREAVVGHERGHLHYGHLSVRIHGEISSQVSLQHELEADRYAVMMEGHKALIMKSAFLKCLKKILTLQDSLECLEGALLHGELAERLKALDALIEEGF